MQRLFAIALGFLSGFAIYAITWGLSSSRPAALAIAVICAIAATAWNLKRPLVVLQNDAVPKSYKWVLGIAALIAIVELGRLTVFMTDPTQVGYSSIPSSQFEVRHSCLSAYYCAVEAVDTNPNIYDESLYSQSTQPGEPRKGRVLNGFNVDQFEYPPPFLLLPRVLHALAPSFLEHRALWFGLNILVIFGSMLFAIRCLEGSAPTRAVLLLPLIFMALPTLSMLQKGNIQGMIIALAVASMLCFDKKKNAVGGALLAYTIVSKLYPGLLVIYLLVRKQWTALGWTAAMGVAYVLVSLADVGVAPYIAFLKHLPGLMGGESFPALRMAPSMSINLSIPGLIFKLKLFGVPGMGFAAAKVVGWIYTAVALWMTVLLARRARTYQDKVMVFIAIMILATLRSPFLPIAYGVFPALWLLTIVAAPINATVRTLMLTLGAWVMLNVFVPLDWLPPHVLAVLTLLPQAMMITLPFVVLSRLPPAPTFNGDARELQPSAA
ncbi:MAG: glycosyltransferase family 87 protein [Povalibacter sp.]